MLLALGLVACGGSKVVQGDVDYKVVNGVAGNTASTILENRPPYDPDAVNDRPSILVIDQEFQGSFTAKDEHAIITVEMENDLRQKYSDISYLAGC